MNSGLLEDVCNFLIVSLTYSTAATQTSFFRTSSQTPMTLPSPSSPSSPTGEEEEDDACCVAVTQPVLFLKVVFFSVSPSVVKAGTELTWKYSDDTQWKQEVPCLCSSDACQGHFVIAENLYDVWCVMCARRTLGCSSPSAPNTQSKVCNGLWTHCHFSISPPTFRQSPVLHRETTTIHICRRFRAC